MFVMVFVVEAIRITVMVSIVFFRRVDFNSIHFILKLGVVSLKLHCFIRSSL